MRYLISYNTFVIFVENTTLNNITMNLGSLFGKKYTDEDIINDFAQAWICLDSNLICKHLDKSFKYDSQLVFQSLDCEGYIKYIQEKFQTLTSRGIKLDVKIVDDNSLGGKMLAIKQNESVTYYRIKIKDNKVVKVDLCMF